MKEDDFQCVAISQSTCTLVNEEEFISVCRKVMLLELLKMSSKIVYRIYFICVCVHMLWPRCFKRQELSVVAVWPALLSSKVENVLFSQ